MFKSKGIIQKVIILLVLSFQLFRTILQAQTSSPVAGFVLGRLKYSGGGDWYNDPSCIPNLLTFLKSNTNVYVGADEKKVQILDEELFSLPMLFLTGHGRIFFAEEEVQRLRKYLTQGGFLYADDDYGMDPYFRKEIQKIFPDKKLVELPPSHPIFQEHFKFPAGIPKIHEHDPGPGRAYGIFHAGRLVVFYTFNTNISDGWADPDVHGDPESVRQEALKMGVNIVVYALTH